MTIDELVGENVRRARVSAGLSALELARRVTGVGLPLTEVALLRLESGEGRLAVDELIALGLALGTPPALLLAPLNLGSLLWVDAEGKPMASWALFHDEARSFFPPDREAGGAAPPRALEAAPAAAAEGEAPPPPPPLLAEQPIPNAHAEEALVPAILRGLPPADEPASPPEPGSDAEEAPVLLPADPAGDLLPPDPTPHHPPIAGLGEERAPSRHRDWALEALQTLQMPLRDC